MKRLSLLIATVSFCNIVAAKADEQVTVTLKVADSAQSFFTDGGYVSISSGQQANKYCDPAHVVDRHKGKCEALPTESFSLPLSGTSKRNSAAELIINLGGIEVNPQFSILKVDDDNKVTITLEDYKPKTQGAKGTMKVDMKK